MATSGRGTEEMVETAPRRGRGSGTARRSRENAREEYDLLIAVALGAAIGAGLALLVRRGPEGRSPAYIAARAASRGAAKAGHYGAKGAKRVRKRGAELMDALPFDDIGENLGSYLEAARETIDDAVARELKGLRKAVRRQRKRFGV